MRRCVDVSFILTLYYDDGCEATRKTILGAHWLLLLLFFLLLIAKRYCIENTNKDNESNTHTSSATAERKKVFGTDLKEKIVRAPSNMRFIDHLIEDLILTCNIVCDELFTNRRRSASIRVSDTRRGPPRLVEIVLDSMLILPHNHVPDHDHDTARTTGTDSHGSIRAPHNNLRASHARWRISFSRSRSQRH